MNEPKLYTRITASGVQKRYLEKYFIKDGEYYFIWHSHEDKECFWTKKLFERIVANNYKYVNLYQHDDVEINFSDDPLVFAQYLIDNNYTLKRTRKYPIRPIKGIGIPSDNAHYFQAIAYGSYGLDSPDEFDGSFCYIVYDKEVLQQLHELVKRIPFRSKSSKQE